MLGNLSGNTRLVPKKSAAQFHIPDDGWVQIDFNPYTQQTSWLKIEDDGKATVRITTPQSVVNQMIAENKRVANDWSGWTGKSGGVVARIPDQLHAQIIRQCGYDPKQGGKYDKKKYRRILNDIDYQKLRTGGGKL